MTGSISVGNIVGGRWKLLGELGRGGFGEVFEAEDISQVALGRAAVKVLYPNTSPNERAMFVQEVQKIAGLRHQNLVGYLDSGLIEVSVDDANHPGEIRPFLVAELCEETLSDRVRQQPSGVLDANNMLKILADVTVGLRYLHGRGLIHRDIKPANILHGDGSWKLADFGLMRDLTATGSYHRGDQLIGTPTYMAPELFSTMVATPASDIYALGVLIHQCVVGRPLHGGSGPALAHNIVNSPATFDPSLDRRLAPIVTAATHADPTQRPTAEELLDVIISTEHDTVVAPIVVSSEPTKPALVSQMGDLTVSAGDEQTVHEPTSADPQNLGHPGAPKWLLPVLGTAGVVALVIGLGVATNLSNGGQDSENADSGGDGETSPAVVDVRTDEERATGDELVEYWNTKEVADALSHQDGDLCSSGPAPIKFVNRHSTPVDYILTIAYLDQGGTRVETGFDTAFGVAPGQSVLFLPVTSLLLDETVRSCEIAELRATESAPFTASNLQHADLVECDVKNRGEGFDDSATIEVTNPHDSERRTEVFLSLVSPEGVRVDDIGTQILIERHQPGETIKIGSGIRFAPLPKFGFKQLDQEHECEITAVLMRPPI